MFFVVVVLQKKRFKGNMTIALPDNYTECIFSGCYLNADYVEVYTNKTICKSCSFPSVLGSNASTLFPYQKTPSKNAHGELVLQCLASKVLSLGHPEWLYSAHKTATTLLMLTSLAILTENPPLDSCSVKTESIATPTECKKAAPSQYVF